MKFIVKAFDRDGQEFDFKNTVIGEENEVSFEKKRQHKHLSRGSVSVCLLLSNIESLQRNLKDNDFWRLFWGHPPKKRIDAKKLKIIQTLNVFHLIPLFLFSFASFKNCLKSSFVIFDSIASFTNSIHSSGRWFLSTFSFVATFFLLF